ncbi:MAG: ABC transporter permease [Candidatus Aminicenantes bacterium]|nr:ABC transporter permease [Candidatus Aminicenantes bacterium]
MRLLYLVKKEMLEVVRQRELLVLLFVAPLIQIVILGYVITTDVRNIPVAVVDLEQGRVSRAVTERLVRSPLFRVRSVTFREEDAGERFRRGEVSAIIVFRDPAAKGRVPLTLPEVQVHLDGVDANSSQIAAGYFNGLIRDVLAREVKRAGAKMPLEARPLIRYNPRLRSINFMGPGIVALLLTILSMFITSFSFVREREQQTMDTLLLSRLRPLEIYAGKALPAVVVGLVDMILGVAVVIFWFGIPVRGNLLHLFPAALLYLAAILSYALIISTVVSNQQQALFFTWFSLVLFLLLGGFFTPLESIHARAPGLMVLTDINPFRYLIKIIREIFLKGNGPAFFWRDLAALAAIALTLTSLSLLNFKRFISR